MRFIVMHKVDSKMESGAPPDGEIIKSMGQLVGESLKQGIFLDGAGLHRSARRVRLRCKGGKCDVERGPYAGANELVASVALVRAESIDAAIELARRYGAALVDGEIEVGPVVEPWDLTGSPKPSHVVGEQFLIAGFSILNVPSREDAIAWATRYAAILVDNEVDVRELAD
jgi:hypothetical protein